MKGSMILETQCHKMSLPNMLLLISWIMAASTAFAFPSSYSAPPNRGGVGAGGGGGGYGGNMGGSMNCAEGEVFHMGRCARPIINRNIFLYAAPDLPSGPSGPLPDMPQPKVNYNIIFIRTPEAADGVGPIVVPPPHQKTLVYVLTKATEAEGPDLIEMPGSRDKPEVYYVNYNDGDNPTLPGGIDLQTALNSANSQQGQVIPGGVGPKTGFGGSSGSGGSSYAGGSGGGSRPSSPSSGFSGISSTYGAPAQSVSSSYGPPGRTG